MLQWMLYFTLCQKSHTFLISKVRRKKKYILLKSKLVLQHIVLNRLISFVFCCSFFKCNHCLSIRECTVGRNSNFIFPNVWLCQKECTTILFDECQSLECKYFKCSGEVRERNKVILIQRVIVIRGLGITLLTPSSWPHNEIHILSKLYSANYVTFQMNLLIPSRWVFTGNNGIIDQCKYDIQT